MGSRQTAPRNIFPVVVGILVLVAAGIIVVYLVHRKPPPARDLHRGLYVESLPVDCPTMGLGVRKLRVVPQDGFTGWAYHLICTDEAGCHGTVRLIFRYEAGRGRGEVSTTRTVDLGWGQTQAGGFLQRPAVTVEHIIGVEGRPAGRNHGEATPTPPPW